MNLMQDRNLRRKTRFYSKMWFKIAVIILAILAIAGGMFIWKTGRLLDKIGGGDGIFSNLVKSISGVSNELKGESEGRINILLLGMRGENIPGGGLLADTIMVVSVKPQEKKVAMISIPRDLYVTVPGTGDKQKINAVHAYGEEKKRGGGLENMKTSVGEVLGLPIHYSASINFEGFKQLIDAVGGVDVSLDENFSEPLQFMGVMGRCDLTNFTVPSGKTEVKKITRKNGSYYTKEYPMCYTKTPSECGGNFVLNAGTNHLDGEKALCFVRSRETSSDFERAKRQQLILQLLKDKLTSAGTLTSYEKISGVFDSIGNNVKSDMQGWEMKKFFEIYSSMSDFQIYQRVLENSEEGLLYHPETENTVGYILLPLGNNYDRIHQMAKDIFTLPAQSDIKPR